VSPTGADRRTGVAPLVVLAVVALVPALLLALTVRWASAQIDEREPVPVAEVDAVGPPPGEPLPTGVFSMRRMPALLSRSLNVGAFENEVAPFLTSVNDRSCAAVSVDGEPVADRNVDLPVIPASNQKIVVAAVALEQLAEDHRYTTTVAAATPPTGGAVDGDLYLVGGGDPLLSSDWYPTSDLERYPVTSPTSLDALADRVVAAGVRTVSGAVVGDASRYDDEWYAPGWGVGVAGLEAGPYGALLVNDARVLGEERRADDPTQGAAREFSRLLAERGVTIGGVATAGQAPAGAVEIASIDSEPLAAVVAEMLGNSDNNTAELLVKEIAFAAGGSVGQGTRIAGLAAMTDQLVEWGLPIDGVVLADGSGLSLDNRLTCRVLLGVLQHVGVDSPVGQGLPVAGSSGTLADVFLDHPIAGRLSGKTGTLNNPPFNVDPPAVKALAGYVVLDDAGTGASNHSRSAVEYVLVLNGPTISDQNEYRPVWNGLVDVLATYPAGATPAELGPR
jgi:serine-type D-Ala-D-Ala carboxypeptidase/endopeptidase (penicillin-binding protein 4)